MEIEKQGYIDLLNQFFDKIYVITLPSLKERQEFIKKSLKGLNYEFYYGVVGKELDVKKLIQEGIYSDDLAKSYWSKSSLPKGHIACSWSHRNLYDHIIENSIQRTLILEDDALFTSDISSIQAALGELPKSWDLFYLGYGQNVEFGFKEKIKTSLYAILSSLGLKDKTEKEIKNRYAKPYSKHLKKAGNHVYTHAYGITLAAAKKLRKKQTPIQLAADCLLQELIVNEELEAYCVSPKILLQEHEVSNELSSLIQEYS